MPMAFSSSASSKTPAPAARDHYEPRSGGGGGVDSCYFPGCRKDANCHCEICIESFNATRDLHSALRFPHMRKDGGVKNPSPPSSSSDDPYASPPLTPEPVSSVSIVPRSPPLMRSTARSRPKEEKAMRGEERPGPPVVGYKLLAVLVGIWGFLVVDLGVLEALFLDGLIGPKLGMEMARGFGEEAKVVERGLKGRLRAVESKVKGAVVGGGGGEEGRVANCSSLDSVWKLNQEGHHRLLFQWRCVIYQSMAEELSVWGSPLQTSGILAAGASARSLTLLSGRITEWSGGKLVPTSRSSNGSSWTLDKWSSAAVQLEGETWVLEYRRSALFQGSGLIQSAWEMSRLSTQKLVRGLKWRLVSSARNFGSSSSYYRTSKGVQPHFEQPT